MRIKKAYAAICIIACTTLLASCTKEMPAPEIDLSAKGAMILDLKKGTVLYEKNADEKFPPASTTKVMTAVVAIENLSLSKEIVPSKKAVYVEPTVAGLKAGVKYTLDDLLSAILIKSANDAAVVIAEAVAGSEKEFAKLMNEKAKTLGMDNTYFATASGLPTGKKDSQHTTARDLAKLMRYVTRYKVVLQKMSQKDENIYGSDGKRIYLKTHNKCLFKRDNGPWGKTGYTREAKRTFVGINSSMKPEICFSILKAKSLWNDIFKLNDEGLVLYAENQRTWFSDFIDWVKAERQIGRKNFDQVMSAIE